MKFNLKNIILWILLFVILTLTFYIGCGIIFSFNFSWLLLLFSLCCSDLLVLILYKPCRHLLLMSKYRNYRIPKMEYFRDIIHEYSVASICKCYSKKVNVNDQIVSTLIKLELDNKIELNYDNSKIIRLLSEENLTFSEKMFIDTYKDINRNNPMYNKKNIEEYLKNDNIKDALDQKLLTEINPKIINYLKRLSVIILCINLFASITVAPYVFNNPLDLIIYQILNWVITFFIILFVGIIYNNHKIYIFTEDGIILRNKLLGLRNFLKDFSTIKDKDVKQYKLYEYYIVYAIIFNFSGKLNNDASKLYKKHSNIFEQ